MEMTVLVSPDSSVNSYAKSKHTHPLPVQTPVHRIIHDPTIFLRSLRRLKATQTAITFYNVDHSFKIMIRNDPIDDDDEDDDEENTPKKFLFDVCILNDVDSDEENDAWVNLIKLEQEGFYDEDDGTFVMENYSILDGDPDQTDLLDAVRRINQLYSMTICGCGEQFIKDTADMCIFCEMSCTPADLETTFCCICQNETVRKNTLLQPCCQKHLHTRCLHIWHKTSGKTQCPLCRKDM